jgi:hypothetical protein
MLVLLEVALIAALWGIAHRQLVSTMRFLTAMNQQGQSQSTQNVDGYKPLARALSLLETGDPKYQGQPVNPFTCNVTILTSSGPAYFTIVYLKGTDVSGSSNETWTVTSSQQFPTSLSEAATWDTMPPTFATGN